MDCLHSSEVDRELQNESDVSSLAFDSDFSVSDLFGDDTDDDPTYLPDNERVGGRQSLFSNRNLFANDGASTSRAGASTSTPEPRPRPFLGPRQRQVLSDSSSSDEFDTEIRDDRGNAIWEALNNDCQDFVHDFDFYETPGPKHCPPVTATPIDFFNLFFTNVLLNLFCKETNRYARQEITKIGNNASPHSMARSWLPTTALEIKAFIAVILNMGLINKPTIRSYWATSSSQATQWFGKMFRRNRFQALLAFFHLVDNAKLPSANQPGYDPTQKFQPLFDHCNNLFIYYYTAHQQLSIDESLIGTKSKTALTQYLPNKHHHRWGIKLWVLCDSVSKYCLNFFCYKGKKSNENREQLKEFGLSFVVVTKLLSACNYLKKGYHVFADNFFTSLPLVSHLYSLQTFFTGTIRKNKKGLPPQVKEQLQVGQSIYMRQNQSVALAYRQKKSQKKPVILISSKPKVCDVEVTKNRHNGIVVQKKPAIIQEYNQFMGGIDTFDMMLYEYMDERRTVKYWKKVVFNLFSRMILNSYILYKETNKNHNRKPMSRYCFVVQIIETIEKEWLQHQGAIDNGGGGDRARASGIEKLPGKQEKTCWVCSVKGASYKTGRKRSRTVCVRCKEGCHGPCFPKHKCK